MDLKQFLTFQIFHTIETRLRPQFQWIPSDLTFLDFSDFSDVVRKESL